MARGRVAAVLLKISRAEWLDPRSGFGETLDLQGRDDLVDQVLDRRQRFALIGADEQVGDAVLAHPSGPADPVDIVLRDRRACRN